MIQVWKENRVRVNAAIDRFVAGIFASILGFISDCGRSCIFFWECSRLIFVRPFRFDEIVKHLEFVGNKSVIIIVMTGTFTGLALAYQIYLGFQMVNAVNLVGPTVAMGITRELGPVLTGLIVSARAGGAMAARLGTMRVSEQIDALEVMGLDPRQYLISPRIVASVIAMPLLCAIFDFIAILASHILCIDILGLDPAIFWDKIQMWLKPGDIFQGLLKAGVFGVCFAAICTNRGFNAKGGAKGVGEATNEGVVNSMVMVIVLNFVMMNLIRFFYVSMGWKQ